MTGLAPVVPLGRRAATLVEIIDSFTRRYDNAGTRAEYRRVLFHLFRHSGRQHPADLTELDVLGFCTAGGPANKTVYNRRSKLTTFLTWCHRTGITDSAGVVDALTDRSSPLRSYRKTYGKVQARNPGCWLTHDEAYSRLVRSCQDGTLVGLRDEIIIRLGLNGMRLAEIRSLTVDNLRHLPTITWTGKGHKPRQCTAGASLVDALRRYLAAYPDVRPADPLIVRQVMGAARQGGPRRLDWHHPISGRSLFYAINERAKSAGLGHVAPHDLRRSAAGILHRATNADGAHHFDLLDIQKVLGHADPATTMRSYLDPMDTDVLDRAATLLD